MTEDRKQQIRERIIELIKWFKNIPSPVVPTKEYVDKLQEYHLLTSEYYREQDLALLKDLENESNC